MAGITLPRNNTCSQYGIIPSQAFFYQKHISKPSHIDCKKSASIDFMIILMLEKDYYQMSKIKLEVGQTQSPVVNKLLVNLASLASTRASMKRKARVRSIHNTYNVLYKYF